MLLQPCTTHARLHMTRKVVNARAHARLHIQCECGTSHGSALPWQ